MEEKDDNELDKIFLPNNDEYPISELIDYCSDIIYKIKGYTKILCIYSSNKKYFKNFKIVLPIIIDIKNGYSIIIKNYTDYNISIYSQDFKIYGSENKIVLLKGQFGIYTYFSKKFWIKIN